LSLFIVEIFKKKKLLKVKGANQLLGGESDQQPVHKAMN